MTNLPILLVEDNLDDVSLTLRALKKNRILNHVSVAHDGAEALEYLFSEDSAARAPYGLVLLDLKLPKIGGLEVLRKMRADGRTQLTPVVILTSSKLEEDIEAGYSAGANAFVRKPVNFTEFAEGINAVGMFWLLLNEAVSDEGEDIHG
jgi:two-component system response regulator